MKNKGFSLVELIVVIAIMAILVGVAVPVYTSYIEKSQIAKDQQLVDEVAHAIQIGQASGQNFGASYIILSANGAATVSNAALEAHLKTIFGDDLGGLELSYDDWKINGNLINVALNLENAEDIGNSTYLNKSSVNDLLGNVQTVTSAAAGLLGNVAKTEEQYIEALRAALGQDYIDKAIAAGVINAEGTGFVGYEDAGDGALNLSVETENQLANLMVFSVAGTFNAPEDKEMVALLMTSAVNDEISQEDFELLESTYSPAMFMASQYAFYKAYALDTNNEAAFEEMNTALQNATSLTEAQNALAGFKDAHKTALQTYMTDKEEQLVGNAGAFTAIMQGVDNVSGNYTSGDGLKSGELFTSGMVSSDVNAYVGAAALADTLSPEQKTALQSVTNGVIIFVYSDGSLAIVPTME